MSSVVQARYSRRQFLARTSIAAAGTGVGIGVAAQSLWSLPTRSSQPVSVFAPDLVDPDTLRQLARRAIDAATAAGATYADIRIADRRMLMTQPAAADVPWDNRIGFEYSYGIRACINGVW